MTKQTKTKTLALGLTLAALLATGCAAKANAGPGETITPSEGAVIRWITLPHPGGGEVNCALAESNMGRAEALDCDWESRSR